MSARGLRTAILGVLLAGGLGLGAAGALRAEGVGTPTPQPNALPPGLFVADAKGLNAERALNRTVEGVRTALARSGGALFAPSAVKEIALREAVMMALERNLAIRRQGISRAIAGKALEEAEAVFDPVFTASASVGITHSATRRESPMRYRPATEQLKVGETDSRGVFKCTSQALKANASASDTSCHVITFADNLGNGIIRPRSPVLAIQFDRERPAGFYSSVEEANAPSKFKPKDDETYNASVGVRQQLPWGAGVDFSVRLKRQQTYYALNSQNGGHEDFGTYYRPYFASFRVGATAPLPFTRNFGPTAAADLNRDLARHQIDAGDFEVKATINSSLLQVETVFWSLVGAIRRMEAINQSLGALKAQVTSVNRLVEMGVLGESDRGQVESQVAGIEGRLQQAFQDYVTASEAMRQLLDADDEVLYQPVGYSALIEAPPRAPDQPEQVLNHPALLRQAVGVRSATLIVEARDVQTRPDLNLTGSGSFSQIGNYGRRSATQAARNLMDPDEFVLSLAAFYQRPIGNRAADAALGGAQHALTANELQLRQIELSLREEYASALATMASARERAKIADRNVALANDLYARSLRLQEAGVDSKNKVPAYEALTRLTSLLNARLEGIQARIDARIAESRALGAVGGLAEHAGERTAQTGTDLKRLTALRESGVLYQFGGPS